MKTLKKRLQTATITCHQLVRGFKDIVIIIIVVPHQHLAPHAREQGKDAQKVFYQPQEQEESLPTQNIRCKQGT